MAQIPVTPTRTTYAGFLRGDAADREMDRQDDDVERERAERLLHPRPRPEPPPIPMP